MIHVEKKRLAAWFARALCLFVGSCWCGQAFGGPSNPGQNFVKDLAGTWSFRLDPTAIGASQHWAETSSPDTIRLPGSLQEQGFGNDVTLDTPWVGTVDPSFFTDDSFAPYREPGKIKLPFWLTPKKHYVGQAWYRKDITIDSTWSNRRIVLSLERCHWQTTVWVDGKRQGTLHSLVASNEFDLTASLNPGPHRLALQIDNTVSIPIGQNSNSISDNTQTDWNGVIGQIQLIALPMVSFEDLQVYPNIARKSARIVVTLRNGTGKAGQATITLQAGSADANSQFLPARSTTLEFSADASTATATVDYPLTSSTPTVDIKLWDEFSPNLYNVEAKFEATLGDEKYTDSASETFGLREVGQKGTQFTINSRLTFLRGTVESCVFPFSGYPPADVKAWEKIFVTCKNYGLNQMRFQSWCPPEAAFKAADELGFYLQIEGSGWTHADDPRVQEFQKQEADHILREYGNHPSFCFMALGSEATGAENRVFSDQLVADWKTRDSRRRYTGAMGLPGSADSEYKLLALAHIQQAGTGLQSRINSKRPETVSDYSSEVSRSTVPIVGDQIGQWSSFPDLQEISRYTGFTRQTSFEIVRDRLESNHLLDQAPDFVDASGALQMLCYKEDIETALRTPGFAGFQLMALTDFPGAGTAPVGILNALWESKGYANSELFKRFCNSTVPLAIMNKRVYTNDETFTATIRIAHFGARALINTRPTWSLTDSDGKVIADGSFPMTIVVSGNDRRMGEVQVPLRSVTKAQKLKFTVDMEGTEFANDWDIWVYPAHLTENAPGGVIITQSLDATAVGALRAGGKVLLLPASNAVKNDPRNSVKAGFSSISFNTLSSHGAGTTTLGILCDPKNPALAQFPTEFHSNWQWWYLLDGAQPLILDDLPPQLHPIVQMIDDWNTNRRLGLVFEARIGTGKLLVSSIDVANGLETNPVARQLRTSLLNYMASNDFNPTTSLTADQIKSLIQ